MSGPHGAADAPAILIAWSPKLRAWLATAILADQPLAIDGPSTSEGRHPADALQALLERRFAILTDAECPPTLVSLIEPFQRASIEEAA